MLNDRLPAAREPALAILIMTSPRAGPVPYADWLAPLGEELFLLAPAGAPQRGRYAEVRTFEDYEANPAVQQAARELHERTGYRAIVAKAECDLVRAGELRDDLGLPGQTRASAVAYRDKTVMKALVRRAGVATPRFRALAGPDDLRAFVVDHGCPVLVKPVDGSGSIGVQALSTPADVERFLDGDFPSGFEVEELVRGALFHVDGLVLGGEVTAVVASRCMPPEGSIAIKSDRPHGSHLLPGEAPLAGRLCDVARRIVAALPSPSDFSFHAEVFHTPDDELVFCEIASRTGGAMIADMLVVGRGLDLDRAWVQAQCGLVPDPDAVGAGAPHDGLAGRILFPRLAGTLRHLPDSPPPWVARYRRVAQPGDRFVGASYTERKVGDFVAGCVVRGSSESQVEQRLRATAEWFASEARWDPA